MVFAIQMISLADSPPRGSYESELSSEGPSTHCLLSSCQGHICRGRTQQYGPLYSSYLHDIAGVTCRGRVDTSNNGPTERHIIISIIIITVLLNA